MGFFSGAGGGLIGGLFGLAGAGIDALSANKQQKLQQQHDKDMAELNQQNQLEQMSVQNQYQIDQWNRENEYNHPSAVADRYRQAGINPRAAFGQGSASGAGIAGGLSSAPSGSNTGSSSNIMYGTNFAGISGNILTGARLQAQNKQDEANAAKAYEQAKSAYLDNKKKEFEESNGAWIAEVQSTKAKADIDVALASMRKFDASLYDVEHTADVKKKRAEADNALQIGRNLIATYDKIISDKSLSDEMRNNAIAERNKISEETRRLRQGNNLFDTFGFYPNASWDDALVGLGAKGMGQLAHFFTKKGQKKLQEPMTPEDEIALKEFKEAKEAKKKRRIVQRIERNIVLNNLPL